MANELRHHKEQGPPKAVAGRRAGCGEGGACTGFEDRAFKVVQGRGGFHSPEEQVASSAPGDKTGDRLRLEPAVCPQTWGTESRKEPPENSWWVQAASGNAGAPEKMGAGDDVLMTTTGSRKVPTAQIGCMGAACVSGSVLPRLILCDCMRVVNALPYGIPLKVHQSYLQAASDLPADRGLDLSAGYDSPKFRSRNQSYMRAVSTLSQASCVSQISEAEMNGQFESVCESVFSEVESQAMDALDLPGCFRTRSHSYLRAIQAGYSQDDECIPMMTASDLTSTVRATTAVSYTNYKRTPPPVPPRTTSKPLISVTAQSSTESTQDAYQDSRAQRVSPWPQDGRGRYNSTDSLDSSKAMSLALETAVAQRHASEGLGGSTRTSDKAILVSKAEDFLKSQRPSIGIQDSEFPELQPYPRSDVETGTDSDTESRGLREYHSVGVQVEDEKRHGRFKRSNSVTAAVQADLELEGFPTHITMEDKGLQFGPSLQRHSEPSTPTQYGALRTVRTQGLFSYREDHRAPAGPASLPPAEPWLEPAAETVETGRMSPCRRDGSWFLKLLHTETKRMEGWCAEMEREAEDNDLLEEILGKIRSAVGSAQLLMSQKFQQFYWLCQQNMDPGAMPRPTSQDLAGYWDMLQLSVEDVGMKFDELHQLKLNGWKIMESPERKDERKVPPPIPKKPPKGKFPITREKSLDLPDRQRQEARRRLLAAKRAASFRQNAASERADSIEIYIPEAQTRL
ncbi:disks large-associated protein 2 [Manis pentadactyla]|uniref:disks large-associated protein 2 n=1 Tax=Manis pentadactyla TaxID=143292 RepID=UPI00255CBAA9|nr:disks large-associated protein 2 [Manis pentadactyla]